MNNNSGIKNLHLPNSIENKLRSLISKLKFHVCMEGIAWALGILLAGLLFLIVSDYLVRLELSIRATGLFLLIGVSGYLAWKRIISPAVYKIPVIDAAHIIEHKHPQLHSLLISAVQFSSNENNEHASIESDSLKQSIVDRIEDQFAETDLSNVIEGRRLKNALIAIFVSLLVICGSGFFLTESVVLGIQRNVLLQSVDWPKKTRIIVADQWKEKTFARGDDIEIFASVEGVIPRTISISYTTESGMRGNETMTGVGDNGFRFIMKNASENFNFFLAGGDDRTDLFSIQLAERPKISNIQLSVSPPGYTRLEQVELRNNVRSTQVILGSVVQIDITTDQPVLSSKLVSGTKIVDEVILDAPAYQFSYSFSPEKTGIYQVSVTNELELDNKKPDRISIRVEKDQQPSVSLNMAGIGEMITPQALLPIQISCSDDFGLSNVKLISTILKENEEEIEWPLTDFRGRMTQYEVSLEQPLESLQLSPGQRISFVVVASDYDDVTGPHITRSQEVTLRIVSVDELLEELTRREQQARSSLERAIDIQEQVRTQWLTTVENNTVDEKTLVRDISGLERRQRNIVSMCNVVRQLLEQILLEYRINQVNVQTVEERLGVEVIVPLKELISRDIVQAADLLRQFSREIDYKEFDALDPQFENILTEMRSILSKLLQWEGYQEVVTMLRDIMRLQEELNKETKQKIQEDADDLFN